MLFKVQNSLQAISLERKSTVSIFILFLYNGKLYDLRTDYLPTYLPSLKNDPKQPKIAKIRPLISQKLMPAQRKNLTPLIFSPEPCSTQNLSKIGDKGFIFTLICPGITQRLTRLPASTSASVFKKGKN